MSRSSETNVTVGYSVNIVGFGWTNGVFLALLNELPENDLMRLAREQDASAGAGR